MTELDEREATCEPNLHYFMSADPKASCLCGRYTYEQRDTMLKIARVPYDGPERRTETSLQEYIRKQLEKRNNENS